MNPLRIRARNYRTFETLDIAIPEGVAAIIGENGAGKSSVVNAIDLALFGPEGRSWSPYLTQGREDARLELELIFEHGDRAYRVRRGYIATGKGKTTLDLEVALPGDAHSFDWRPLTRETIDATQTLLEEILGLSRETFRASAFLAQGDGAAFTEAKPAARKEILGNVLGLRRFERLRDLVRRDVKAATSEIDRLNGELQRAERELDERGVTELVRSQAEKALETLAAAIVTAEGELALAAETESRLATLRTARAEAATVVAKAEATLRPLEERRRAADEADRTLTLIADELETLTTTEQIGELERREAELAGELETFRADVRRSEETARMIELREAEKAAIEAQAAASHDRMTELDRKASHVELGDVNTCPTCAQDLGVDARKATTGSLRAQAQAAADEAEALFERAGALVIPVAVAPPTLRPSAEADLQTCREQIRRAREAELQRERLNGRTVSLREAAGAYPSADEVQAADRAMSEAVAARDALPALDEQASSAAEQTRVRARDALIQHRADLGVSQAALARATGTLERLDRIEAETGRARGRRAELLGDVDELAILDRAYGRDGIPALIVSQSAIPAIEFESGRILGELGGATASCRIELRTEKALASGAVADALDVIVVTPTGERPYETFSGGERTRLNLALRIALARLLAHRRGAESRLLAIDEPEFLDAPGTAALATVLRGISSDFNRLLLISHVPDLRDAFDVSLEVVKRNDRSEIR